MILNNLEPAKVFDIFENISKIPHGSYNIDAISDWIVDFAKKNNLEYIQDSDKNVVVRRKACEGFENIPTLTFQGHIDMVCSKDTDVDFDFTKDALDLYVEDDFLKARGTTLGADDGIFIAYALAFLTDDSLHTGELEAVFTVNEEVGLLGAASINAKNIHGKYFINIDTGEEDSIVVSCAGGQDGSIRFSYDTFTCELPVYELKIDGLYGGHSGEQINQGLGNANKILMNLLYDISKKINLRVSDINGGVADNVIPSSARCKMAVSYDELSVVNETINSSLAMLKEKFKDTDPNLVITLENTDSVSLECINSDVIDRLIGFSVKAPNGVVEMSSDIDGLVETSLNFGVITTNENCVEFIYSIRSASDDKKLALFNRLSAIAKEFNGDFTDLGGYPGWEFKKDSFLRPIFQKIYKETHKKELRIEAIHAGLECGIFAGKIKDLDCVSMGPDMFDIHTTNERLSISSTKRTYDYLIKVINCFTESMRK